MILARLRVAGERVVEAKRAGSEAGVKISGKLVAVGEGQGVHRYGGLALQSILLLLDGVEVGLGPRHPDVAEVPGVIFRLRESKAGDGHREVGRT